MAEIIFNDVSKRFPDGTEAVKHLSLTIADGEFMILVGPSGCGKTTVLRMLAGLEQITSGELLIDGRRANELQPRQRDIAMVFQSYALYPHMTVAKNMGFALRRAGLQKAEVARRVQEAARLLGISDQLARKPSQLSGGQRQRVAMGRAIVREPKAFLMDEPLSNLDAQLRVQMRAEITRIQRRLRTTTVYVTHDQTEAMTLGDRLVVMREGVIQQVGTPEELYQRPGNVFVAGFIGAPSMNVMAGQLDGDALRLSLTRIPLDDGLRERLTGVDASKTVLVGIRPEDFEDATLVGERRQGHVLEAMIDVLEPTGPDVYAHLALAGQHEDIGTRLAAVGRSGNGPAPSGAGDVVVRLGSASELREGAQAKLWLDTSRIHLFDADTGERLQAGRPRLTDERVADRARDRA
jgi:multiple sugar transport system ATP-binding protein